MSDQSNVSDSEEDYEVEAIVGHEGSTLDERKYEVKWKGYKETTLEPRENLYPNSGELLIAYDKKHPVKMKDSRTKSKSKRLGKSRRARVHKILDTEGEDKTTDSNRENVTPNLKTKRKRTSSKRQSSKIKSRRLTFKSKSFKKGVKVSTSKKGKKKKKKGSKGRYRYRMIVESSSDEEYEVDILLDHRDEEDGRKYLVKWEGYPNSDATWEPVSNLSCKSLVRQYEHVRGTWKKPQKRSRDEDEKRPSKRLRKNDKSTDSDHEQDSKPSREPAGPLEKKGETESNDSEGNKDAEVVATDDKEISAADNEEKRGEQSKNDKPNHDIKADAKIDMSVDEKKIAMKGDDKNQDAKTDAKIDVSVDEEKIEVKGDEKVAVESKTEGVKPKGNKDISADEEKIEVKGDDKVVAESKTIPGAKTAKIDMNGDEENIEQGDGKVAVESKNMQNAETDAKMEITGEEKSEVKGDGKAVVESSNTPEGKEGIAEGEKTDGKYLKSKKLKEDVDHDTKEHDGGDSKE